MDIVLIATITAGITLLVVRMLDKKKEKNKRSGRGVENKPDYNEEINRELRENHENNQK